MSHALLKIFVLPQCAASFFVLLIDNKLKILERTLGLISKEQS
jgi:hypothetical protein